MSYSLKEYHEDLYDAYEQSEAYGQYLQDQIDELSQEDLDAYKAEFLQSNEWDEDRFNSYLIDLAVKGEI